MGSELPSDRIAIITVHGTGDTGGNEGEKWFQRGSAFTQRLLERLRSHGVEAEVLPHHWSGANSVRSRERSAKRLAKAIRNHARNYASVHVVGHSHGGNVANDAACMIGWPDRGARQKLTSVTTVGTPFFLCALMPAETWSAIAFLVVVLVNFLALIAVAAGLPDKLDSLQDDTFLVTFLLVLSLACFLVVFPLAWRRAARARRLAAKLKSHASIYAIFHAEDEAIAVLQRAESMRFDALGKGALLRSVQPFAVGGGIAVVFFVLAVSIVLYGIGSVAHMELRADVLRGFGDWSERLVTYLKRHENGLIRFDDAGVLLARLDIILAPIIFLLMYALVAFGIGGLFELLRGWFNRRVHGAVRAFAFGRDGEERIGQVQTKSHHFDTVECVVPEGVADRMRANADAATDRLLREYRADLLSVNVNPTDALERMRSDKKTWESLVHTTYFDQAEIIDLIGDRIALEAQRAKQEVRVRAPTSRGPAAAAGLPGAA